MMHCGKTAFLIYLRIDLIHLLHFHDHLSSMQKFQNHNHYKNILFLHIYSFYIIIKKNDIHINSKSV